MKDTFLLFGSFLYSFMVLILVGLWNLRTDFLSTLNYHKGWVWLSLCPPIFSFSYNSPATGFVAQLATYKEKPSDLRLQYLTKIPTKSMRQKEKIKIICLFRSWNFSIYDVTSILENLCVTWTRMCNIESRPSPPLLPLAPE